MDRGTLAARYFTQGYNCAQSVALAFTDVTGLTPEQSARMVSGFGGGVGRLREVCGAVSGMVFVASCLYGYDAPNPEAQQQLYALIQQLAGEFKAQTGSVICREILKNPPTDPTPDPRTAEYYAQRPCARMCYLAANALERYIAEHTEQ